jgi:hypothetical protein
VGMWGTIEGASAAFLIGGGVAETGVWVHGLGQMNVSHKVSE